MHETREDLRRLQDLLDRSHAAAGGHMKSIFQPRTRMSAQEVVAEMSGVQVLDVATVNAKGEPRVAPVDGLLYKGHLYFGSSPESVRMRHLAKRPQVSAAHTRGEELTVIAHGTAVSVDVANDAGFHSYLLEVYGPIWDEWHPTPPPYVRIDPKRMYAARVSLLAPG